MADLQTVLTDPSRRLQVVRDAEQLLNDEVDRKSFLVSAVLKAAMKGVKTVRPAIIPDTLDGLLDDFAKRLDPFYQAHLASGGRSLVDSFTARKGEIADALLAITDDRARVTRHTTLKKAYEGLRPQGKKHVEEAIPGVARLVEKHSRSV